MSGIGKDTKLQTAVGLQIRLESDKRLRIALDNHSIDSGPWGLAILDVFHEPRTIDDAVTELQARSSGVQSWMDMTAEIFKLQRAGVLVSVQGAMPELGAGPSGYDSARVHVAMLNDRVRTERFLAGIREVVRSGDVVVDIGTGTGILAIAAARAGADRVYAIEAGRIGRLAEANFKANGLADRVMLINGWSTEIELPERADVLVSEMIGNDPFGERVLEVTSDAVKRLLKPRARLVPRNVKVFALPVSIPESEIDRLFFSTNNLKAWEAWYGADFSGLAVTTPDQFSFFVNPSKARWRVLGPPIIVADADLNEIRPPSMSVDRDFEVDHAGVLNGVMICFELEICPNLHLSTHPDFVSESNHWTNRVWVLSQPIAVEAGRRYRLAYNYRSDGQRDGVTVSAL